MNDGNLAMADSVHITGKQLDVIFAATTDVRTLAGKPKLSQISNQQGTPVLRTPQLQKPTPGLQATRPQLKKSGFRPATRERPGHADYSIKDHRYDNGAGQFNAGRQQSFCRKKLSWQKVH